MGEETTGPEARELGRAAMVQVLRGQQAVLENLLKTLAFRAGGVVTVREADVQRCLKGKLEINEYPEMATKDLGALIEVRVTGIPPALVVVEPRSKN